MTETIKLTELKVDQQIQLRKRWIDESIVQTYVEALGGGAKFPPVVAFSDDDGLWLADGFHRLAAYRFCGLADIAVDIRAGTRQDAMIHAAIANVTNGKPMSRKERQEAGLRLLKLTDWNDLTISRRLSVDRSTVTKWRLAQEIKSGSDPLAIDCGEISPQLPETIQLITGDFAHVGPTLEAESYGMIITDPPYGQEFLHLYELLAVQAKRLLKPGGSLLVMTGQFNLPHVFNLMMPYLSYHWTISYTTSGGQSPQIWPRKVNTFWKPVLWFVKGEYAGVWHGDVVKSDANDKRFHGWGQSESGIGQLVSEFAFVGANVLDPFVGGGTTALVCYRLKIPFTGIDIDKGAIDTTYNRIIAELNG